MYSKIIKNFDIEKIAASGQIFRLRKVDKNYEVYNLFARDERLVIAREKDTYLFSCNKKEWDNKWSHYFDLDYPIKQKSNIKIKSGDPYKIIESTYIKSDLFLKSCVPIASGIRILNQDPWEMLISFIISQRKSIKAIQTSIERLCWLCGKKKCDEYAEYFTFPTAEEILREKSRLNHCSLGYREEYIVDACEKILSGEIRLYDDKKSNFYISKMTDEELIDYLMHIKGVGIKVASCVALFSYHRLSVCPEDIWIKRVKEKYYKGVFPDKYKKILGVVQQYWFMGERAKKVVLLKRRNNKKLLKNCLK